MTTNQTFSFEEWRTEQPEAASTPVDPAATMDASLFAAINAAHFDVVPETALRSMERTGQAYTNEVRAMAREILRLRSRLGPRPFWEVGP